MKNIQLEKKNNLFKNGGYFRKSLLQKNESNIYAKIWIDLN
jgi:hypothetical protein